MRKSEKEALLKGMLSNDSRLKINAIKNISEYDDSEVLEQLYKLTADSDVSVRYFARKAIKNFSGGYRPADSTAGGAHSLPAFDSCSEEYDGGKLYSIISSGSSREKQAALKELLWVNDESALPFLIERLGMETDDRVIATLLKLIGHFGDESHISVIAPFLKHADKRVAANAVEGLESIDSDKIIELLVPYINDDDNRIRANVLKTLAKFDELLMVAKLERMISSGEIWMRDSAVYVLESITPDNARPLLQKALKDVNQNVAEHAQAVLEKINSSKKMNERSEKTALPAGLKNKGEAANSKRPLCSKRAADFIFISYSRKDCAEVYRLLSILSGADYDYWYDVGIKTGVDWDNELKNKIINCSEVFLFVSENSLNSPEVHKEIICADKNGKKITPIFMPGGCAFDEKAKIESAVEKIEAILNEKKNKISLTEEEIKSFQREKSDFQIEYDSNVKRIKLNESKINKRLEQLKESEKAFKFEIDIKYKEINGVWFKFFYSGKIKKLEEEIIEIKKKQKELNEKTNEDLKAVEDENDELNKRNIQLQADIKKLESSLSTGRHVKETERKNHGILSELCEKIKGARKNDDFIKHINEYTKILRQFNLDVIEFYAVLFYRYISINNGIKYDTEEDFRSKIPKAAMRDIFKGTADEFEHERLLSKESKSSCQDYFGYTSDNFVYIVLAVVLVLMFFIKILF
ncbi:MAG: HEAT repeat domain-containing protein [Candidatus Wallbacteria bacterium]